MAPSRGTLVTAGIGVAVVGVLVLQGSPAGGPALDPRSHEPDGTSALVALLEGLGAEVELSEGLPGARDDVALVLVDRLDEDQTEDVLAWVRAGGTLVVTDPRSSLTPEALPFGPSDAFPPEETTLGPGFCDIGALADVQDVDAGIAFRYDTGSAVASCLGSRDFAFVVAEAEGDGEVVSIGGADLVTNERLDHADNAVLAASLLAPQRGTSIRVVDPPIPAGGDKTLVDLISDGVRRAALQLGIAFLVYAVWRAVRLGRPVAESQPVEIAGSELVGAAGRLLERGRGAGPAAEVLRGRLRRSLSARFGVAPHAPTATFVATVTERTGLDPAEVDAAVGERPVASDDELVDVTTAIAHVHQEVLR